VHTADAQRVTSNEPRRHPVASDGAPAPLRVVRHPLTPREQEVLKLITEGDSNKVGGHRLGISSRTFEVHRAHVMRKLGARNASELVRIALDGIR